MHHSKPNRLIQEKSPYLLQHAHNPVDWFPWCDAAFQKAKAENKPIFLSIGYSTCHWCHVMEHESFENQTIADRLNEDFVSIKVDREERPDIDHIYMQAVMAMSGSGGWPMSIFLTPEKHPFYGGTYFPPEDKWGRSGFLTVLNAISRKWKNERDDVLRAGQELTGAIQEEMHQKTNNHIKLDETTMHNAFRELTEQFDVERGGFGHAPKFPRTHILSWLLRYARRFDNRAALKMVEGTFQAMICGGINDHLGGGFHRYSTDEFWHVPHFEKMLYDQALVAYALLETYQVTKNKLYAQTARSILDYVLRDMTSADDAFYSAEDADSAPSTNEVRKTEGAFYVWTEKELSETLDFDAFQLFQFCFGVQSDGNARSDPHGEFTGKNILYEAASIGEAAKHFGISEDDAHRKLNLAKQKLFDLRLKRPRPHLDDKVLTDWNGLMIAGFALAARVLNEEKYLTAAKASCDFILSRMMTRDGSLLHRYRDGEAGIPAFLDDYVFFIHGLIDLFQACFDPKYLEAAQRLSEVMCEQFWDASAGGFFISSTKGETLFTRGKEIYDGALPSGNSMAVCVLSRLSSLTGNSKFKELAEKTLHAFSEKIDRFASGYPQILIGLDYLFGPSREVVIVKGDDSPTTNECLTMLHQSFHPNQVVMVLENSSRTFNELAKIIPFAKDRVALQGKTTVYICRNHTCDLPLTDIESIKTKLRS